jgi:hypothetical protein
MAKFEIDLQPIIDRVAQRATNDFETNVPRAAEGIIRDLFDNGRYRPGKEGLAHEILRKKIEEYVLSDAYANTLDAIIEAVAEEQMTEAVKVLVKSKTRKVLFEATTAKED